MLADAGPLSRAPHWTWRNAHTMPDLTSIFGSVQWTGAVALGLCYVGAVFGVYLTFRILNFPNGIARVREEQRR
jgi:hypothetical protein